MNRPLPASLRAIEAGLDPSAADGLLASAWTLSVVDRGPQDDGDETVFRHDATIHRDGVPVLTIRTSETRRPDILWMVLAPHEEWGEMPVQAGAVVCVEPPVPYAERFEAAKSHAERAAYRRLFGLTVPQRRKSRRRRASEGTTEGESA